MNKSFILVLASTSLLLLSACSKDEIPATAQAAETKPQSEATATPTQPAALSGTSGAVTETMDASGYTYVQVDTGKEKIWAAAPQFSVAVGDQVVIPQGMAMKNYHSQTLNRDFEVVYFVESVLNASNPDMPSATGSMNKMQMPEGHPPVSGSTPPPTLDFSELQKAAGGYTIGEVYAGKDELSGKTISVRGKVVKFSPQIMSTNWIHIQDGSGTQASATHDLTVTSNTTVKVGDTVLVKAPLTLDKDFSYGYKYDLILEGAEVTVE